MRGMFRLTLLAGAAVAMLGIVVAHHTFAAASRPARGPTPQYNVLFSRDDKLCTTLRDFYNRHLHDRDSEYEGYLEDRFGSEVQRAGIEFLHETSDWKPYGSDGLSWVQVLPNLDIYNDGSLHSVVLLDSGDLKFIAFRTQILVLRPGVDPAEIPQITNLLDFRDDPRLEQWIDFASGGSSLSQRRTVYRIPEVPASENKAPLGAIGAAAQRLLRYKQRIYGVARVRLEPAIDAIIRPGARIDTASILAYSVTRSGSMTDMCYLETPVTFSPRADGRR
ncbi:MAG TPA: hypothetical protein VNH44_10065 [Micropepsaceae bacterium]|nr:hypothetical protein [Micropepsaceae bacterium]